ncbi:golvesin C-terminal-like domain-containing protein [Deferrisoma camini]|uniref:golvesin C-terminal-like domain-containing protein n=1 Tax=Deferrisoma camini TaxID=1035120 RepID=UPI00046D165A|nr:CAP domain-containing protein [Deferrisoma camini]
MARWVRWLGAWCLVAVWAAAASGACPTADEAEVVRLINEARQAAGLGPLQAEVRLTGAARGHSRDMAANGFFSHTGSDGSVFWQRIRTGGYGLRAGAENIAAGYRSPSAVVNAWMASPGHRANILGPYRDVGVGVARGGPYGVYWTVDFATPLGASEPFDPVCSGGDEPASDPVPTPVPGPPAGGEVVVDDGGAGTSFVGLWRPSAMPGGYGSGSLYCVGYRGERYRWTPRLPAAGRYRVFLWWAEGRGRSMRVPVRVRHAGGESETLVNQRRDGGRWNLLGTFEFRADGSEWVELSGENGQASADAVRFVPATGEPADPPAAANRSPQPRDDEAVARSGETVGIRVLANDTDPDGDPLTVVAVGPAAHGRAEVGADGVVEYTPDPGFAGNDAFSYTAGDGRGGTAEARVTVRVDPPPPADAPSPAVELVLDEDAAAAQTVGLWRPSRIAGGYQGDSLYCLGLSRDRFRWTPDLPAPGPYRVYLWWTASQGRSPRVPVRVRHAGGEFETLVNQRRDGGRWNLLGTFEFRADGSEWVELSGENGQASADAVRFVPAGP